MAPRPTDAGDDSLFTIEREVAVLVRRLEQVRRNVPRDAVVLDRASYLVLDHLQRNDGVTAADLARELQLDHSTVTRQVAPLEHEGLLRRVSTGTSRAQVIEITDAGQRLMGVVRTGRAERMAARLADWSPADRARLATFLTRFNESLR